MKSFSYGRDTTKCIRWMPRHQKTKKDVAACEKPREGGKQPVIRGYPNGETHFGGRPEYSA